MRCFDTQRRVLAVARRSSATRSLLHRSAATAPNSAQAGPPPETKPGAPETVKEGIEVKVVHLNRNQNWPVLVGTGVGSVAGVAGLIYALGGFEPAGPTPEELAELKASEERKKEEARQAALLKQQLAEEAARKAAEEAAAKAAAEAAAREEAERAEAAAAAKREKLCAAVAQALDLVKRPGVSGQAVAALDEALRMARLEASLLETEEVVVEASSRLAELHQAAEAREALPAVYGALQDALLSRSAQDCRGALAIIDASTEVLTNLGEAIPADGGVVEQGRQDLQVLELAEMRCAAAMASLENAVKSCNAEECANAVKEAEIAGVGTCPQLALAETLSDPERLYEALARESAVRIMDQQGSFTVTERRASPPPSVEDLDETELRKRAVELAQAIVVHPQLMAGELQAELSFSEAELVQRCIVRMDEALERMRQKLEAEKRVEEAAVEENFQRRTHEAVSEVVGEIFGEAEAQIAHLHKEAELSRQEAVTAAREDFQRRFAALSEPMPAIDKLVVSGKGLEQFSQTGNKLSQALIKFQGALLAGRPAYEELAALKAASELIGSSSATEAFVSRLLATLPIETVEWSRGGMHSEPELSDSFRQQLSKFVAGAFVLPAQGDVSSAISSFTSSIFGYFYVLGSEPTVDLHASMGASMEVQQNLDGLGVAAQYVERGNLRLALGAMEQSLTGECRRLAKSWMTDVRNALLLQQAARAAQAKVTLAGTRSA